MSNACHAGARGSTATLVFRLQKNSMFLSYSRKYSASWGTSAADIVLFDLTP